MCAEIFYKLANECFNHFFFFFFFYNVGKAKNYYSFNSWLYFDKDEKKLIQKMN